MFLKKLLMVLMIQIIHMKYQLKVLQIVHIMEMF